MWAEERRQKILSTLESHNRVAADELASQFEVSRETIRRDLKTLEDEGLIRRTHGGALHASSEQPFRERISTRSSEKRALTQRAAQLLQPGECCFIDAGSTTSSLGQALAAIEGISIITNSVPVVMGLRELNSTAEILLLGGTLGRDVPASYGPTALEQLANLRADVAFISPVGIDPQGGVTYFDFAEAQVARMMLRNTRRRVILADASKCNVVSRVIVCPTHEVDVLVTDIAATNAFSQAGIAHVLSVSPEMSGLAAAEGATGPGDACRLEELT